METPKSIQQVRVEVKAAAGLRRKFCLQGPEYYGCMNTGKRPRIIGSMSGYWVGTEDQFDSRTWGGTKFYTSKQKKQALNYFGLLCHKVFTYNTNSRNEVAQAQAKLQSGSFNDQFSAMMVLADQGAL